jgi:outer membrane protein assembly factor BamB
LQNGDADIGSTAPAILPPSSGKYSHLGVQSGKDGVLRLLNLDDLSGQGRTGHTGGEVFSMNMPIGGGVYTTPAVWVNPDDNSTWVFIANGYNSGLAALKLVIDGSGNPSLQTQWTRSGGTSPVMANGILFFARSNLISALDPTSGSLLWSDTHIGGIHWESPIVASGILYITDESGHLTAYAVP